MAPTCQKAKAANHCEMSFVQFLGDALAHLNRACPFKGLHIKPGPGRQPAALCKVLLWVRISVLRLLPRDPPSCTRKTQAVSCCVFLFIYFFNLAVCRQQGVLCSSQHELVSSMSTCGRADDDSRFRGAPRSFVQCPHHSELGKQLACAATEHGPDCGQHHGHPTHIPVFEFG